MSRSAFNPIDFFPRVTERPRRLELLKANVGPRCEKGRHPLPDLSCSVIALIQQHALLLQPKWFLDSSQECLPPGAQVTGFRKRQGTGLAYSVSGGVGSPTGVLET